MVGKGATPTAQLGLSWGNTQAAVLAGLQGPSALLVTLGVRGYPGSRSGTSLRNSHISYSHMCQGPFVWPRCPQDGEGGRQDPDLARTRAWHQGPRCRCATSVRSRHGPPSFPCPALSTPPPARVARIRPENAGVTEGGAVHVQDRSRGMVQPWCAHPGGAEAPTRLLVGETVGVGEELLRGEPILGHVSGAAADQVVRHAAARHRDPT